ncbi:nuclear transport factor 2 family protein [Salininema proteolyticum]|uniref:Nuclear transport factor 2 family protein n=1 Tax=Salininema proteolyticum TaxID=1607685 RepID=A0ABV8U1M7_9ACTN
MHDFKAVASRYIDAFNAVDAVERKRLVAEVLGADVAYVDPMAAVDGHEGMDAFIAGCHRQFPGWTFTLIGEVDGHHDQARFSWGFGPAGEEPPLLGFDVIVLDGEGRIKTVFGFLDRVPAA